MSADYLVAEKGPRRIRGVRARSTRNRVGGLQLTVIRVPFAGTGHPGAPFVLVHGIGVSSRYFQPLAAELAQYGDVILVDLPGFGSAPNPRRPVSIQEHADVLAGVLELEGIRDPVLVGHSMGTQVVSRLLADQPALSDRLVLLAPTTNPAERTLGTQLRLLLADLPRESAMANLIVATDYLFRCGIPYFLSQVPNLLDDHIEERLPGVRASTLVVRGDRDPIVPRDWARSVAALIPNASFLELAGPHVVMYSNPGDVAVAIVEHAAP